jgi:hypothetical protein
MRSHTSRNPWQAKTHTWQVDATAGADANSGNAAAPIQTITKVNALALMPGDRVLFKRVETWSGTVLSPPASGKAGRRITFGNYGSGAQPIVDSVASASAFILNGKNYITVRDIWFRYGTAVVVNADVGHDFTLQDCTIEGDVAERANGIDIYGPATTTYNDHINRCVVFNNRVSAVGGGGIVVGDEGADGPVNVLIEGCTVHDNGTSTTLDHGIYILNSINAVVRDCSIYSNTSKGISLSHLNLINGLIERNRIYSNNQGIGIHNDASLVVRNNLIYSNVRGMWATGVEHNANIYHNTFINNADGADNGNGIRISSTVTGLNIKNNIIVQDKAIFGTDTERCLWVADTTVLADNTFDYNLYYYPGQGWDAVNDVGGASKTFAQWQALAGSPDPHGVNADPVFVTNYTDLHLQTTSPAKNAGATTLGVLTDYDGVVRDATPDMGAFEFVA